MKPARQRVALVVAVLAAACAVTQAAEVEVERGQQVFAHRCGMCHREGGTGTLMLTRRLGVAGSLLEKRADLAPAYIRFVVRNGIVSMPRITRVELPESDMDAVIAYLTSPKVAAIP